MQLSPPLAYLITWTTYGSWPPGDPRGWVDDAEDGIELPAPGLEAAMRAGMSADAVVLSQKERTLVEETIVEHCLFRGWILHAVNVRTNHVHVVVTAVNDPDDVASKLKARCSRQLNLLPGRRREKWWTRDQSTKWINDESYLRNAIRYVKYGQ